ncbi:MAG: JmjC domain-containing protein [Burkholderiaceae bacterium]
MIFHTDTDHTMTPINEPQTLLGGLTAEQFMSRYWQKKPLLIRQAIPHFKAPISRAELFSLAKSSDVESRLVQRIKNKGSKASWSVQRGPFKRGQLPALSQKDWTLLVQGVNLHHPMAEHVLSLWHFLPRARLDDLMISFACDGGGVGPHFDSYDVFLLQASGQRRWRIGAGSDQRLVKDAPLKILSNFTCEQEYLLEPGDMLYLPPQYAHDGVAIGECMTYSIGFKAPDALTLVKEVLLRYLDRLAEDESLFPVIYSDRTQKATQEPGMIPVSLQNFAMTHMHKLLSDQEEFKRSLGEYLSEPKDHVWFEQGQDQGRELDGGDDLSSWLSDSAQQTLHVSSKTQLLYDQATIYINAESVGATGLEGEILKKLANQRFLLPRDLKKLAQKSPKRLKSILSLLGEWLENGWVRLGQE